MCLLRANLVLTLQKSLRNLLCTGQCIHEIPINPLSVSGNFFETIYTELACCNFQSFYFFDMELLGGADGTRS